MDWRIANVHPDSLRCRCTRSTSGCYAYPERDPSWFHLFYFRDVCMQSWLHVGWRHDDRVHRLHWEHGKLERCRAVLPVKAVP